MFEQTKRFHESNQRSHEEGTSQKLMFKHKFDVDRKTYNKHRNPCVSLIRSEKKNLFSNIITSDIKDKKKTFWKAVKPFVIYKIKIESNITLIEKQALLLKPRLDLDPNPEKTGPRKN